MSGPAQIFDLGLFGSIPFPASLIGKSDDALAELGRTKAIIADFLGSGPGILIDAAPGRLDSGGINRVGGAEIIHGGAREAIEGNTFDIANNGGIVNTIMPPDLSSFFAFGPTPTGGDFNGNGLFHVVLPDTSNNQVFVFDVMPDGTDIDLGGVTSLGGFIVKDTPWFFGPSSLSAGDIDGNGMTDFFFGDGNNSQVRILFGTDQPINGVFDLGNPGPGFDVLTITGPDGFGRNMQAGDWDGDGDFDDLGVFSLSYSRGRCMMA